MHRDVEKGELRQASQAIYLQNVKKKKNWYSTDLNMLCISFKSSLKYTLECKL